PVATASTQADLPILLMLLVGASLLSVIQHHLLGISYLSGRRAVSFLPFFAMICGCLAGFHGYQTNLTGRILRPALAILAVVLVACFARAANLDRTMTWSYDNDTREMMSDLSSLLADRRDGSPARLGITWFLEPSINYYRVRDKVVNLAPVDRATENSQALPPNGGGACGARQLILRTSFAVTICWQPALIPILWPRGCSQRPVDDQAGTRKPPRAEPENHAMIRVPLYGSEFLDAMPAITRSALRWTLVS